MKKFRAMKDISLAERKQILIDCFTMSGREVREKWNITNNVLSHIRFFHGKSSAKVRGYYYKNLLEDYVDPQIERIRQLKNEGKTSGEIAEIVHLPLPILNKLYVTV